MGLKSLIENQTIIIDDHKRGNREIKNWDDIQNDVHIDKKTNFRINGKKQNFRIRIPINSDRPIKIENTRKNTLADLPGRFQKEIREAFEDKVVREHRRFVESVVCRYGPDTMAHVMRPFADASKIENALKAIKDAQGQSVLREWDPGCFPPTYSDIAPYPPRWLTW